MSKKWLHQIPPYEGDQPYLYFAFAEADSGRVWKYLRPLLERGCRLWYSCGPAGSAEELLRRQERAGKAALTVVFLTDAVCADKDTKSFVLVNQKFNRALLCLDPDGVDRRLSMNLREDVPIIPLYRLQNSEEIESAILHADGFSQDMLGEPVKIVENDIVKKLSVLFCVLAVAIAAISFAGYRCLHWFQPAQDEIQISDPVLQAAVRQAVGGGAITEQRASELTFLRLEELPESWDELSVLPALEWIELPQRELLRDESLPDGDYLISLSGGGGA